MDLRVHRLPHLGDLHRVDEFTKRMWTRPHTYYTGTQARRVHEFIRGLPLPYALLIDNVLRAFHGYIPLRNKRVFGDSTTQFICYLPGYGCSVQNIIHGEVEPRSCTQTSCYLGFIPTLGITFFKGANMDIGNTSTRVLYLMFEGDPKMYRVPTMAFVAALYLYEQGYRYKYPQEVCLRRLKDRLNYEEDMVSDLHHPRPLLDAVPYRNVAPARVRVGSRDGFDYFNTFILPQLHERNKVWEHI